MNSCILGEVILAIYSTFLKREIFFLMLDSCYVRKLNCSLECKNFSPASISTPHLVLMCVYPTTDYIVSRVGA